MSIRSTIASIYALIATLFTPGVPAMLTVAPSRGRRGATFIEYALLAGIALVLFFLFRSALSGIFNSLFGRIRSALA